MKNPSLYLNKKGVYSNAAEAVLKANCAVKQGKTRAYLKNLIRLNLAQVIQDQSRKIFNINSKSIWGYRVNLDK